MIHEELLRLLSGPFHFLRPTREELDRLLPGWSRILPVPQRLYLEVEEATPARGFPVLRSRGSIELARALAEAVAAEEAAQLAIVRRETSDRSAHAAAWQRYRGLLVRALENATLSSYGRRLPAIFWLQHSFDLARLLKETPRRLVREDLETGRRQGDAIKYRVAERWLDRVLADTYDVAQRLSSATEEAEEEIFPQLFARLRDNVLVLTEDHISSDLGELSGYFSAYLRIDGRELLERMEALAAWHERLLADDARLRDTVRHLAGADPEAEPSRLLRRPEYLAFLSGHRSWDRKRLPTPEQLAVWTRLLDKLAEFELLNALRRYLAPVERSPGEPERLVVRGPAAVRLAGGAAGGAGGVGASGELVLSESTRPLDFFASWVIDPLVDRFGLIYDITDFSEILSVLERSGSELQDRAFRRMFRLQRRINRLAAGDRLKLEKYLGDGAFYSSRAPQGCITTAVRIQRAYRAEVEDGFAFDRGLRQALNYGRYRLIPIESGPEGERYEFFGHSLVELSRLTTGKARREIEEIQRMLLTRGYPEESVRRFFAPLVKKNLDTVDRGQEARPFPAYLDPSGHLVNEGIVATGAFVRELSAALGPILLEPAIEVRAAGAGGGEMPAYLRLTLRDASGEVPVGLRKLGLAQLKGIERVEIYEVVDGEGLGTTGGATHEPLAPALETWYNRRRSAGGTALSSHG